MEIQNIGIIANGVTGRMGTNQHLMRSLVELRDQGGIRKGDKCLMPEVVLTGRNPEKLEKLSQMSGFGKYSTDTDALLSDPTYQVYFDAQITERRFESVKKAIGAGKHVYCEKPVAESLGSALELYHMARSAGVKNGVVQDKLFLPGMIKLKRLIDQGFFGRILSVRGEFGYWVFEGHRQSSQRPSWNYRKEEGGGIITDMLCHWRYLLDNLFGQVQAVCCKGATHVHERVDEQGKPYQCTAEDAAYACFELEGGIIAQFNSSWATRVRRDDLLVVQVDGTEGSAVAGLRDLHVQDYEHTPRPVWNPDLPQTIDFFGGWEPVCQNESFENGFKTQWELFLRHVAWDEPFSWNLLEGAKGVQLAEKGLESWQKARWVNIDELKI